jgi:predicted nucleic acid-binding Zn ribbon protein
MRPDPDRVRLAAEALARARADAWSRGERPSGPGGTGSPPAVSGGPGGNGGTGSPPMIGGIPGGRPPGVTAPPGATQRRDDPQSLNAALGGLLSARGWRQRAAVGAVFGGWAEIVGPQLAAHTRPESFDDGELVVAADSPAWATQVRLLAPQLLKRLAEELGAGTVRRVRVRGPSGSPGPQTAARRGRHVRLTQPQESVTTAKMVRAGSGRCPK